MDRTAYHISLLLLCILVMQEVSLCQKNFLKQYSLQNDSISSLPPSNSVSQIVVQGASLWIGSGKGIAKSTNGGRSWVSYRSDPEFANDGIFALTIKDSLIWVSTGYDKDIGEASVQTGSGYTFSIDGGDHWTHLPQTLDGRGDSILTPPYGINDSIWILPVVVPEQNVTFDISLSPGTVWITSWASGLRKSIDSGRTWQRIPLPPADRNTLSPSDTLWTYAPNDTLKQHRIFLRIDPRPSNPYANNYLAFAVHAIDNDTVWCGTAGGVNKSTDGGQSWVKFNHQNQVAGILGNWVIAIDHQKLSGKNRIWTTNWKAEGADEQYGVSYTDDGGRLWTNLLHGIKAYDFAFKDSIAYIATDEGIYRTADGGVSFIKVSSFTDADSRQIVASSQVFSVNVLDDTVFVGTGDGIARTIDNAENQFGASWKVYRSYQAVGNSHSSYAYPNPFAPNFGPVRIHYATSASSTVSIDIFDFGMNRVRTLIHGASRNTGEQDELWEGRNDEGKAVANGVYFYRIKIDSDEPLFGKILVLQ